MDAGLPRKKTMELWARQDRHAGDRARFFRTVTARVPAERVLYPGSWCDVAASACWPSVTYVDTDRNAARFFDDAAGVERIIEEVARSADRSYAFLAADYNRPLPLEDEGFDVLVSLYSGPLSPSCTRYLRIGGTFVANPSHGDVALAALDPRYRLAGVVLAEGEAYRVAEEDLKTYLVPKKPAEATVEHIQRTGRGIAYTRAAFAYLFTRVG